MSTEGVLQENSSSGLGGKYLTFVLAGENYGIPILSVREIIGVLKITPVPNVPAYVDGVVNLRGKIIPVFDLRTRFGMQRVDRTKETCIIVVQTDQSDRGILVDRVSEVVDIPEPQIEVRPQFREDVEAELIQGIGKSDEAVTLLLDTRRALDLVPLSLPGENGLIESEQPVETE